MVTNHYQTAQTENCCQSCQQNHTKTLLNKIKNTIFPAAILTYDLNSSRWTAILSRDD